MQDNYQDIKPQPLNEQIYSQQRVSEPQYYQQQVPYQPGDHTVLPAASVSRAPAASISGWFDFSNPSYLKGFVIAAGITLVTTNPSVQQALIKGGLKVCNSFQGGVEEIKEQIQDIEAEMGQK
jgi:hypothetical protein